MHIIKYKFIIGPPSHLGFSKHRLFRVHQSGGHRPKRTHFSFARFVSQMKVGIIKQDTMNVYIAVGLLPESLSVMHANSASVHTCAPGVRFY